MKKLTRILSVALIAVMLLAVSAAAVADDTTVYIPDKLSKLGLPDMPDLLGLKTKSDSSVLWLYFDERPDWAVVLWSEGPEDVNFSSKIGGKNEARSDAIYREGHKLQPGAHAWNDSWVVCDPITGKIVWQYDVYIKTGDASTLYVFPDGDVPAGYTLYYAQGTLAFDYSGRRAPSWTHGTYGEDAYKAGKGNVTFTYGRDGSIRAVTLTVEEDFYKTGMEGASTEITWKPITVFSQCGDTLVEWQDIDGIIHEIKEYRCWDSYFYIDSVVTTYPAGNYIVKVETGWRNDKKNTLATYRISYATSETETYRITYAPATNTVLYLGGNATASGKTYYIDLPGESASINLMPGVALMHCEEDEILQGEYTDGKVSLKSGSGRYHGSWFGDRGRRPSRRGLKSLSSFVSPRVK